MRQFVLLLAVAFVIPTTGCKKPEFQEFSPPDGRFKVQMPGKPSKQERDEQGLHLTAYTVENRNEAFMVAYSDIPNHLRHDLDGAVQGFAQKAGGTNVQSKGSSQTTKGEFLGWREFEMAISTPKPGYAAGRVLFARGRLYMVISVGTENRLTNPDVQKFISSFSLTDGDTPGSNAPVGSNAPSSGPAHTEPPQVGTPEFPKDPVVIKPVVPNPTPKLDPKPTPKVDPVPTQPKKPQALGGPFDTEFTENAPAGGVLIGFDVGISSFAARDAVGTLRPIFRVGRQEILGELHGSDSKRTVSVVAKDGYAVGAISVKAGLWIDGFSLTFMKVVGDKLDPNDSYKSEWIGGPQGTGKLPTQDGGGKPVVGIIGKVTKQTAKNATGIGLIFKE